MNLLAESGVALFMGSHDVRIAYLATTCTTSTRSWRCSYVDLSSVPLSLLACRNTYQELSLDPRSRDHLSEDTSLARSRIFWCTIAFLVPIRLAPTAIARASCTTGGYGVKIVYYVQHKRIRSDLTPATNKLLVIFVSRGACATLCLRPHPLTLYSGHIDITATSNVRVGEGSRNRYSMV